jgi:hypothetical protein
VIKLERKIKMKEGINPITDVCDDEVHDDGSGVLFLEILHTPAGYYLGTFCQQCGPYDRKSQYMTEQEAQEAFKEYEETGEIPGRWWRL